MLFRGEHRWALIWGTIKSGPTVGSWYLREQYDLLDCNAVQLRRSPPTILRNVSPPFSGSKSKQNKQTSKQQAASNVAAEDRYENFKASIFIWMTVDGNLDDSDRSLPLNSPIRSTPALLGLHRSKTWQTSYCALGNKQAKFGGCLKPCLLEILLQIALTKTSSTVHNVLIIIIIIIPGESFIIKTFKNPNVEIAITKEPANRFYC
jgi:hypothetical protein